MAKDCGEGAASGLSEQFSNTTVDQLPHSTLASSQFPHFNTKLGAGSAGEPQLDLQRKLIQHQIEVLPFDSSDCIINCFTCPKFSKSLPATNVVMGLFFTVSAKAAPASKTIRWGENKGCGDIWYHGKVSVVTIFFCDRLKWDSKGRSYGYITYTLHKEHKSMEIYIHRISISHEIIALEWTDVHTSDDPL